MRASLLCAQGAQPCHRPGVPVVDDRSQIVLFHLPVFAAVAFGQIFAQCFQIVFESLLAGPRLHHPVDVLSATIAGQTSIRDYIDGEKVIQGFLAAYLGATEHFVFHTERELGGGDADICLEPHLQRYAGMRHVYVIELKYLKRSGRFQRGEPASEERVARAAKEAAAQVRRYVADEWLARQYPAVRFTGLAFVFHGWELVHAEATSPSG